MIALIVNYYFDIAKLNFNLIIWSLALLGLLSIVINVWHKTQIKKYLETNYMLIFQYKNSKIIWTALGIGVMTIIVGKELDSQIKILTFSIGIYLVLSQVIEFIGGKYFNTNILAITENSLIDLNGRINKIKIKDIKAYERKSESIIIQDKYETFKYNKNDFHDSSIMIEIIDDKLNKNKMKAR